MNPTPGPWEAWSEEGQNKSGDYLHSVCRTDVSETGHAGESFHQCVAEAIGRTREEAEANALLIAAAPALLSAAIEALAFIERHTEGFVIDAKDSLRLAIADATGGGR